MAIPDYDRSKPRTINGFHFKEAFSKEGIKNNMPSPITGQPMHGDVRNMIMQIDNGVQLLTERDISMMPSINQEEYRNLLLRLNGREDIDDDSLHWLRSVSLDGGFKTVYYSFLKGTPSIHASPNSRASMGGKRKRRKTRKTRKTRKSSKSKKQTRRR